MGKAKKRVISQAHPFDVWGMPPRGMLHGMTDLQLEQLKGYITKVTGKAYRLAYDLAYDNGIVEAYTKVAMHATVELKRERDRMLKKTNRRSK